MYDLVIENANLVTCDKNHNVIWNASMAIADGSIQVIESDSEKKIQHFATSQKIDAFIDLMRPLGLKDVSRSGVAAISRGVKSIGEE